MRKDMAKVVTERPRRGHANTSKKWGRRLHAHEYDADDHGSTRAPIARYRQYGGDAKQFSDLIGPLRGYLHKQIGRPWNAVWSEITQHLDLRSITGQHINDHIKWELRWGKVYVHPVTGLVCARKPWPGGRSESWQAFGTFRAYGIRLSDPIELRRYRVDGTRVWERRETGWFIHIYRHVPEQPCTVVGYDGIARTWYHPAHYEFQYTKQASKREIQEAQALLQRDPLRQR